MCCEVERSERNAVASGSDELIPTLRMQLQVWARGGGREREREGEEGGREGGKKGGRKGEREEEKREGGRD